MEISKYTYDKIDTYSIRVHASILIPFLSGLEYLNKTLASLSVQVYPREFYEVIVIHEKDQNMSSLLKKYRKSMNVRLISKSPMKFSVASARNVGQRYASHGVIISLDFDSLCPPHWLSNHLKWFRNNDKIATIGMRKFIDSSRVDVETILNNFAQIENLQQIESISNNTYGHTCDKRRDHLFELSRYRYPGNLFYGCNVAYRLDDAKRIGNWDEGYDGGLNYEDIDFGHRLWFAGIRLVFAEESTVFHQENVETTLEEKVMYSVRNRKRLYSKFPALVEFRESTSVKKSKF